MVEELSGTDMMSIKESRDGGNRHASKIIVANDQYIQVADLKCKFDKAGLGAFTEYCIDGNEAVEKTISLVNSALLKEKFFPIQPVSLLILDVNMPRKNGMQALEEIQNFYHYLVIPEGVERNNYCLKPTVIMNSSIYNPHV